MLIPLETIPELAEIVKLFYDKKIQEICYLSIKLKNSQYYQNKGCNGYNNQIIIGFTAGRPFQAGKESNYAILKR